MTHTKWVTFETPQSGSIAQIKNSNNISSVIKRRNQKFLLIEFVMELRTAPVTKDSFKMLPLKSELICYLEWQFDMIFEWIDENGTLGKCKTKNNKDGCCETMNMKLTKRMYDKSHNKFYNDIDKSRCSYEGKCSTVQYVRKWSFLESKGSRWS